MYTTSYRSRGYSRRLFWLHGIRLAGVVNQARHTRKVRVRCTKYPPQFGIELLVDDAAGVGLEGERHGFRVQVLPPIATGRVARVQAALAGAAGGGA